MSTYWYMHNTEQYENEIKVNIFYLTMQSVYLTVMMTVI